MPFEIPLAELSPSERFAIVVSRYNSQITGPLLAGAIETLTAGGIEDDQIHVAHVPGAWEIPLVAKTLAESGRYRAVICLGAVIRGETSHDQHINRSVSHAMTRIACEAGIPVLFGVLTCETLEQAVQRSGGRVGNKGCESAEAALTMVRLMKSINDDSSLLR